MAELKMIFLMGCLMAAAVLEAGVVVDLTEYSPEEFRLELQNHETIFVKYYTLTCPHCKSMAKDFALVARQLQEQNENSIVLAEVDCSHDAGQEICSAYAIAAFPTLTLFRYGFLYQRYEGQRNAQAIKKWLLSQVQGSSRVLPSVKQLQVVSRESDAVLVSAVVRSGQMKLLTHFLKASKRVKRHPHFADLQFFHVIDDDMPAEESLLVAGKPVATVTLRRPQWHRSLHEPEKVSVALSLKLNLTEWVFKQTYGSVVYRSPKTERNIHDPRLLGPLVVIFYDFDFTADSNSTHHWRDQILALVGDYPKFQFAISRSSDYAHYLRTKWLPVPGPDDAPVVVVYDQLTIPYAMNDSFTISSLKSFLDHVMDPIGYPPRLLSDSTCPDHVNWTLDCLTGQDFKQISLANKPVLLLMFKSVSDATMKLAMKVGKVFSKVGKDNAAGKMVHVFAVDASANQLPHAFDFPEYPVLYYITSSKMIHRIEGKFADTVILDLTRDLLKKSTDAVRSQIKTEL